MAKKQKIRSEQYIHIEARGGAFRFKVTVGPYKNSATFSTEAEGWRWARELRQEFLKLREFNQEPAVAASLLAPVLPTSAMHVAQTHHGFSVVNNVPVPIQLSDVFDSYEKSHLPHLTGKQAEASRLSKLRKWFGALTVDQLDQAIIRRWQEDRLAGKLGSGRDPNRAATKSELASGSEVPLTKHQRHYRKKLGKDVPEVPIYAISTQTVRHELNLLRRTVTRYLEDDERRQAVYGPWWKAHYLSRMDLPDAADPRNRRVSDDELVEIFSGIKDTTLKAAILFAVLTSLRRGEIISLLWEDVDFERKVVWLRKPASTSKSKIRTRQIPLLTGAVKVLQDLGPRKNGRIFQLTASDLSHGWRNAADKAEIYDARLHDCRRESISRLVETLKLSLHEVVLFSGHSDIATLQKHYLRLDSGRMASRLSENPAAINFAPSL